MSYKTENYFSDKPKGFELHSKAISRLFRRGEEYTRKQIDIHLRANGLEPNPEWTDLILEDADYEKCDGFLPERYRVRTRRVKPDSIYSNTIIYAYRQPGVCTERTEK